MECIQCGKKFDTQEWKETKGTLKGFKVVKSFCCSTKCKMAFDKRMEKE